MKHKYVVKTILSLVLTTAMVFGTVQLPFATKVEVAHAEWSGTGNGTAESPWQIGGVNSSDVKAVLDNGTLTISGTGAMADFDEAPWKAYRTSINNVVIENGVTSIGNEAFLFCSGLTTVDIPDSVTSIGKGAFYRCSGLTTITIPNSVTSIGEFAFEYCYQLTTVTIPYSVTSIGEDAFLGCTALRIVYAPVGLTIPVYGIGIDDSKIKEYYAVKLAPTEHGAVTVSGGTDVPNCGAYFTSSGTATLTITPDEGYTVKSVKYNDGTEDHVITPNDGTYSFEMPNKHVTVTAEFKPVLSGDEDYTATDGKMLTGSTTGKVTIADGAAVTLSNATIGGGITCAGDATITLEGENTVTVTGYNAGIYVPQNSTLTINGTGELEVTGGKKGAGIGAYTAYTDGSYQHHHCGNIIINSGKVIAKGGGEYGGAGIGGAYYANCGTITINDGTVISTGTVSNAGVGGGYYASFGDIKITGGDVTATGGYDVSEGSGAGIGGGAECCDTSPVGNITITGGVVSATGKGGAAGIGGGDNGSCGDILISGGNITAEGGSDGVSIGGGYAKANNISCGTITITDGITKLVATRGDNADYSIGKGKGYDGKSSTCGTVTIGCKIIEDQITGGKTGFITDKKFETQPFAISFGVVGGTGTEESVNVMKNVNDEYTLPDDTGFSASGSNTFVGWVVNTKDGNSEIKAVGDTVKITVNTTLIAFYAMPISAPAAAKDLTYTGKEQTGVAAGTGYELTGNIATDTGDYMATATLAVGYVWSDNTLEAKKISWSIAAKKVDAPTIEIAEASAYTGAEIKPAVTVKDGDTTIPESEYMVSYSDNVNAGTAKVTVTDKEGGNYTVSGSKTFAIAKATPAYEKPSDLKAVTGQTLTDVSLPTGWSWADKTLSVGSVGSNIFKATYTPTDTANYTVVENVELTVTVSRASGGSSGGSTGGSTGGSIGGSTGGGGNAGGGSGSAGSGTADKDKTPAPMTEKKTNADGSVTETTKTTNADGSKTETEKTTTADGTVTESKKTTATDGSVKETGMTTTADGTVTQTEKTTSVDGTVTETEKTSDASGTVTEKTSVTEKDGSSVVTETVTEKDGSSKVSEIVTPKDGSSTATTVTVGSGGKAKSIVATESDGKKDSQTVSFEVKGNKVSVSEVESSTGIVTIPEQIEANGKTYKVTKIDKNVFDGKKIKELNLSDSVKVLAPKSLAGTDLKKLNLKGENTKLKKNCLKDTNRNLVITVNTKAEKKNVERQLKKAGNPNAKVKVSKKK